MARRKALTDLGVALLRAKPTRYTHPDPDQRGHYVRVTPNGAKTFVAVARDPDGKQIWATIGTTDMLGIEESRDRARDAIQRIRQGLPPVKQKAALAAFRDVAENYLKRHVQAKALLSESEIRRCLEKYIYPRWADREFVGIRRGDVAALLDEVQDNNGPRQADYVLAIIRGISNWFATRNDDYTSPVVRGMRRTDPKSRKRDRVLGDDELGAVWAQAEVCGTFGAVVRLALLTAQRREKIAAMRWDDITVDGIWHVPGDDREKGTGGDLLLPEMALAVIRSQHRMGDNPYVFAGRGDGHFNGFSPCKRAFDKRVPIAPWVIHDLRRSARSLMSRAGVRPDVAERVMGHVIGGVEGVYDRHHYRDEKADALAKLATVLGSIINPTDKVVPLRKAAE